MTRTIDHISVNDLFWIQFKSHLISFGFKGLPDGIHFTIGFDSRTPDANLHVTKNHSDPKDKPKIKIFVIDKALLEEIAPSLSLSMLNSLLEPIDIDNLQLESKSDLGFISFNNIENSALSAISEQKLIDSFKDISRFRKKSRLKIKGNFEERLENFVQDNEYQQEMMKKLERLDLTEEFKSPVEGGIILTSDNILYVIRINALWYTFKTDLKFSDIFTGIMDARLVRHLIWKTKRAIIQVKNAETYLDTKKYDNPIRLE
ncbi:hypothetical protein GC194_07735 [bacterium]|nr:hypothetical protein [bacterium]